MAYSPTTWVDDSSPPINAANLNKIEQGIVTADRSEVFAQTSEPAVAIVALWADTTNPQTPGAGGGGGGGGLDQAAADLRYVNVTGDTLTGALTLTDGSQVLNAAGPATLSVDGTTYTGMYYKIGGNIRYFVGADNTTWKLAPFNDAGSEDWTKAMTFYRSSGDLYLGGNLFVQKMDASLILDSATPSERYVRFRTDEKNRWTFGAVPGAETGSNAGSDFSIARWADDGSWIDNPIGIVRSSGLVYTNALVTYGTLSSTQGLVISGPDTLFSSSVNMQSNYIYNLQTPNAANDAANKGYVDTKVALSGGTMTGGLVATDLGANTVSAYLAPTDPAHVTRKDYVDTKVSLSGGTMTGELGLEEGAWTDRTPTDAYHVTNKAYVDNRTPKITVGTTAPSSPAVGDLWVDTN